MIGEGSLSTILGIAGSLALCGVQLGQRSNDSPSDGSCLGVRELGRDPRDAPTWSIRLAVLSLADKKYPSESTFA